jgi:hypothetical protein
MAGDRENGLRLAWVVVREGGRGGGQIRLPSERKRYHKTV